MRVMRSNPACACDKYPSVDVLASVFPSPALLNCLFLHHWANLPSLFLSFSLCFLLYISTSSPVFTASLPLSFTPLSRLTSLSG